MNFLIGAFKPPCNISISFADARTRKQVPLKKENGQTIMVPLFQSQENIVGEVLIEPQQGKKVEHTGVKIELLGQIELYFDRGNFYDFTSLVRELDVPGDLYERKTYPFEFSTVEMPYESYNGVNVRLRWSIHFNLLISVKSSFVSNDLKNNSVQTFIVLSLFFNLRLLTLASCLASITVFLCFTKPLIIVFLSLFLNLRLLTLVGFLFHIRNFLDLS
ncbi:hypothetical protein CsSME_00046787 [Camellia sinensis var. sinensis]